MKDDPLGERHPASSGDPDRDHEAVPVNPATGQPYFTINAAGWSGGWTLGRRVDLEDEIEALLKAKD